MILLTFARLRKNKVMVLVPLLICCVALPAMGLFFRQQSENSMEEAVRALAIQLHVWIPVFSTWWGIALFHDFFESGGNELLYLYHRPAWFLKIQCVAMLAYSLCILACFIICRQILPLAWFLFIQLAAEAFFAAAFAWFLSFALLNTGVGLLTVAAYGIYINLFDTLGLMDFMSIFPKDSLMTRENVRLAVCSVLWSLFFLALGFFCSKFRREYK